MTNCSGQTLATGALLSGGTNFVNVGLPLSSTPLPSAQVDLLFSSDDAAFFLAPPTPFELDLSTAFTNQSGITGSIYVLLTRAVAQRGLRGDYDWHPK